MSKVTLIIGGRDYAVACSPGEEAHVTYLGELIDEKLLEQPAAVAQSEVRSLLFAALLLADELSEARVLIAEAPAAAPSPPAPDPAVNARMAAIADRLEQLAATIEALA